MSTKTSSLNSHYVLNAFVSLKKTNKQEKTNQGKVQKKTQQVLIYLQLLSNQLPSENKWKYISTLHKLEFSA